MRIQTLAMAGIALALATTLAACGGDDDTNTAAQGDPSVPETSAAPSGKPGCDPNAPGSCDEYDPNDPFANPKARCPKGGEPANTITASGNTFCAENYSGKVASKWTFDNPDIALHNVATDDFEKNPAKFKTKDAEMGKKVNFTMPKKAGKYTIICTYHPGSMTAKLSLK
ncbi:MAG: cupredoxin domain-containing protein [Sporichthyaceae bacterium]